MTRTLAVLCVVALLLGACPVPDGGGDGGRDGGGTGGGGGSTAAFELITLDATARDATYFAMAVDRSARRVGVAYFTPRGTETNVGVPDFDLKYVEWRDGVTSPVETIRFVQRKVGLSVTFDPVSNEPVIAFLGGDDTFVPGSSFFWFQSDAALAVRAAGVWTQRSIATTGGQATCGNPVSDRGLLVGLWPSVVFDGTGNLVFAWRDGHDTTLMDWQGSDVESAEGPLAAPLIRCVNAGGNGGLGGKPAWGGRIQLAVGAGGQPGIVYDRAQAGADTTGLQVWFQQRSGGGWTAPKQVLESTDTQTGGSLAWDAQEGWGVAGIDGPSGRLQYASSQDGVSWSTPQEVFGAGSGGWYPSLAMDPIAHEPTIAFYVCSPRPGQTATQCTAAEDELRVTRRGAGQWQEQLVDAEGGWAPKLGYFASGVRVISYRDPRSGVLKLAVER